MLRTVSYLISFQFTTTQSSQVITKTRSSSEGRRFMSGALCLPLHRRPLRTMRPPPPAVATELQWGELCQEPLAPTHALLGRNAQLGQSCCPLRATVNTCRLWAVNPNLAPLRMSVGAEERGAGQE